jgi:SSS family solute:Na+ symporter
MELSFLDIGLFVAFFATAIGISMYKSRKEATGEDFFLASRGLIWPMIGLSLIAANISTEQIVGMAGQGAGITGMAVASYEWIAAVTLVFVGLFFIPVFLRSGIYTMPEFLEYRYNKACRTIMAGYMMIIYVAVTIAAVIYSGALTLSTIFDMDLVAAVWLIGAVAAVYTTWGGLKAVVWADLFLGTALIVGGCITLYIGLAAVGGLGSFMEVNADKLHMVLPADHPVLPWTALVIGIWIPNFYYWGLNQYITQRALGARSIREGQIGIMFAAFIKLLMPFIIVFPGIIAYQLYSDRMELTDAAYPLLIRNLVPVGLRGLIFAALAGAVISSLASMLNSASTIFTMDLYRRYIDRTTEGRAVIRTGRVTTVILAIVGCLIAPQLGNPRFHGIFNYIQEFQGFVSPGILAAFVFGMLLKRAPGPAGVVALLASPAVYGLLLLFAGNIAFLNRMAITFVVVVALMTVLTVLRPLPAPKTLPVREGFDCRRSPAAAWMGAGVIAITVALYVIFW